MSTAETSLDSPSSNLQSASCHAIPPTLFSRSNVQIRNNAKLKLVPVVQGQWRMSSERWGKAVHGWWLQQLLILFFHFYVKIHFFAWRNINFQSVLLIKPSWACELSSLREQPRGLQYWFLYLYYYWWNAEGDPVSNLFWGFSAEHKRCRPHLLQNTVTWCLQLPLGKPTLNPYAPEITFWFKSLLVNV